MGGDAVRAVLAMKSDKELADEIEARERLVARGYTKIACKYCGGFGKVPNPSHKGLFFECVSCDGRGYTWQAQFTR